MKILKRVTLSTLLMLGFLMQWQAAHAVAAIAIDKKTGITRTEINCTTRPICNMKAVRACEKISGHQCQLLNDTPIDGPTAIAIAHGTNYAGFATNPSPKAAYEKALSACNRSTQNCYVGAMSWDEGKKYAALAEYIHTDGRHFPFFAGNEVSAKKAMTAALRECQTKLPKQYPSKKCWVTHRWAGSVFYVEARSNNNHWGFDVRRSLDKARENALTICERFRKPGDAPCKVTQVKTSLNIQAPKSFYEYRAKTRQGQASKK